MSEEQDESTKIEKEVVNTATISGIKEILTIVDLKNGKSLEIASASHNLIEISNIAFQIWDGFFESKENSRDYIN